MCAHGRGGFADLLGDSFHRQTGAKAQLTKSITRTHDGIVAQDVTPVMLTTNTKRVTVCDMTYVDLIKAWGLKQMAADLGLPVKNVRRWEDFDSIPADWFVAVAAAAAKTGRHDITVEKLAQMAEAKRLMKAATKEAA